MSSTLGCLHITKCKYTCGHFGRIDRNQAVPCELARPSMEGSGCPAVMQFVESNEVFMAWVRCRKCDPNAAPVFQADGSELLMLSGGMHALYRASLEMPLGRSI